MTRRNNHSTRTVRVNRIERLETRQMLSADGLSCNDFHQEFATELARSASSLEALRGSEFNYRDAERIRDSHRGRDSDRDRGGRLFGGDHRLRLNRDGFELRNQDRFRSGFGEGRRGKADRQFGRESNLYEPQLIIPIVDLSGAEGELLINSGLTYASTPIQTTPATTTPSSITTSRITFVIFLPVSSSSYSSDSTSSRSASNTLARPQSIPTPARAAVETESRVTRPIIKESRPSQEANPEPTSAVEIANEVVDDTMVRQTDAVQLVSFRTATDLFAHATTIGALPENLSSELAESANIEFMFELPCFGDSALDQLLERSQSLEDDFTKLEELLDAISVERLESPQYPNRAAASWTPAEEDIDGTAQPTAKSVSDRMILIRPGTSLVHPTSPLVAQAFALPEDSAINQWTVGVGFYRALEVVGDTRFADALIAAEISVDPVNVTGEQNEIADVFAWQSDSAASSRQAAGLVFCCLGIQYLRKRRKERESDAIASRPGNAPGEGTMD